MFKGGDIGGVGQAPERRNGLSLASTRRGRSARAQRTAPPRAHTWAPGAVGGRTGRCERWLSSLSLACCGATAQPFAG